MKQELKDIGDIFKQRRKELNLSLKEVENATSIRSGYLEAIEEGEDGRLISPIYTQGFIKQYASFLGMDPDALTRDHPEIFMRAGNQEFAYGIGTLEVRGNPGASVKWFPNAVWLVMFVVVLAAAWYFAKIFEVL